MDNQGVDLSIIQSLIGHRQQSLVRSIYSGGPKIEKLREIVNRIDYGSEIISLVQAAATIKMGIWCMAKKGLYKKDEWRTRPLKRKYLYRRNYLSGLLVKLNSSRQSSNMWFGMSVSVFRLNIIGMTPVFMFVTWSLKNPEREYI